MAHAAGWEQGAAESRSVTESTPKMQQRLHTSYTDACIFIHLTSMDAIEVWQVVLLMAVASHTTVSTALGLKMP